MDLVERVQYKAALIVTGCWQGTSRERLHEELGWESLSHRRCVCQVQFFPEFAINSLRAKLLATLSDPFSN